MYLTFLSRCNLHLRTSASFWRSWKWLKMYCYIEEATQINEEQTAIYYMGLVNVNLIRIFHQQFFLRKNFNGHNSLFIRNLSIRGYTRTLLNQLNQLLYTPRTLSKQQLSPRNRRFLHQKSTPNLVAPSSFTSGILQTSTPNVIHPMSYFWIMQQTPFTPLACHTFTLSLSQQKPVPWSALYSGNLFKSISFTPSTCSQQQQQQQQQQKRQHQPHTLLRSYTRETLLAKHLLQQTPSTD